MKACCNSSGLATQANHSLVLSYQYVHFDTQIILTWNASSCPGQQDGPSVNKGNVHSVYRYRRSWFLVNTI